MRVDLEALLFVLMIFTIITLIVRGDGSRERLRLIQEAAAAIRVKGFIVATEQAFRSADEIQYIDVLVEHDLDKLPIYIVTSAREGRRRLAKLSQSRGKFLLVASDRKVHRALLADTQMSDAEAFRTILLPDQLADRVEDWRWELAFAKTESADAGTGNSPMVCAEP